jgi:tRNA pseudouridine38-40 synthase
LLRTWKVTLEYDGTRYSGWQEQQNARTVAGDVRRVAEEFLQAEVELHGSGRTDAGVHALAQVAHMRAKLKSAPRPEELRRAMNAELPGDIAILRIDAVDNRFHARHDALSRSYVYQISKRKRAFEKRYVWWVKEPLHIEAMSEAASALAGRHDFVCFRAPDPSRPTESTIVVVDSATVEDEGDMILFRIQASHFLWRMVRRIAGVLVKVGKRDLTVEEFHTLLDAKCDPKHDVAAWTAPAAGLFLERVVYPDR